MGSLREIFLSEASAPAIVPEKCAERRVALHISESREPV
jgi:hypothetical protein